MGETDSRTAIADEAARWWTRVGIRDPRTLSVAERETFTRWLKESPVHVAEFLRVAHVHEALTHFKAWNTLTAYETETNVAGIPTERFARLPRWMLPVSIAIVVLLATGLLVIFGGVLSGSNVIQTERAERREVMLNDGSVVQLEPETRISVRLTAHARNIVLSHGRALFRVTENTQRPFYVQADDTVVRAVGTAFGVEERPSGVVVTVAEGRVAVRSSHPEVLVAAGQQVVMPATGATTNVIPPVRAVDPTRALAWAQGKLVFENETLANVIAEFNRYNRLQLRLSDPAIAARRVSGVFQATDPETLLAFIEAGNPVRVRHDGALQVFIDPLP